MSNAIELLRQCRELYDKGLVGIPVGNHSDVDWVYNLEDRINAFLAENGDKDSLGEDYCNDCNGLSNHCMCDFEDDDDDDDDDYEEEEYDDEYDTEEFDNEFVADTFHPMNPFVRARFLERVE